jgi:hypothetical protein
MKKSIRAAVLFAGLFAAGAVAAQGMLLDFAADKVIKKFSTASCEELKAQKTEPPSEKQKMAIDFLKNDSEARKAFIDKIAPTVMNKMFECGMIP